MKTTTLKVRVVCVVILFSVCITNAQITPANVSSNLQLWFKADDGISTSGTEVTGWIDQSSHGVTAAREGSNNGPQFLPEGLNFNPMLAFDPSNGSGGVKEYLRIPYADIPHLNLKPLDDKMTFFCVFIADDADSEGAVFAKSGSTTRNFVQWLGEFDRVVHYTGGASGSAPNIGHHWGDGTLDARYEPKISAGFIMDGTYGGTPRHVFQSYVNGVFDEFPTENPSSNQGNAGIGTGHINNIDFLIGARRANNSNTGTGFMLHNAEIGEIIIYDRQLSMAEINKIESYLAIKYGVTLGYNDSEAEDYTGTSKDYTLADGSTLAWEGNDNKGYGYAVFGIARDDNSELLQLKSTSTNVQRITTTPPIILNSILVIEDEDSTIANDQSFLMTGHDGKDIVLQSADVPERVLSTISRKWKARSSANNVGSIKMTFDLSQYTITNPEELELLVSYNEDLSNYKNIKGVYNSSDQTLTFTNILLEDNQYYTLGKVQELNDSYHFSFNGGEQHIKFGDQFNLGNRFTVSGWIRRELGSLGTSIISKRDNYVGWFGNYTEGYDFRVNALGRLLISWYGNGGSGGTYQQLVSSVAIPLNRWHHVAAVYNGSTVTLYIDGVPDTSDNFVQPRSNNRQTFRIGAGGEDNNTEDHFVGDLDEIRIWNVALTATQLRYIMNQEIQNNAGSVNGRVVPNSITKNDIESISWRNLEGYFPFSHVKGNCFFNKSQYPGRNGDIIGTANSEIKPQTAPLPYVSANNGNWDDNTQWVNGNVQVPPGQVSLVDNLQTIDWNIVRTSNNLTINNSSLPYAYYNHKKRNLLALFVDSGTIRLQGNTTTETGEGLTVTHYLKLDGKIDLAGESQLIQTDGSDLDPTSSGHLERDQQGTRDLYTYNYWSSPVGTINSSTNNNNYQLRHIFLDGTDVNSPASINFVNGYDGNVGTPISVSNRWIYKFNNQPSDDYSSWSHIGSTNSVNAGEGFTMKGVANTTGNVSLEQNYVFRGKPNNGDITLNINADNDYLVGNPYPSAIDAVQFIIDNGPIIEGRSSSITGTLYFWEHWGGGSHILSEYQGGYATYNLSGATPAAYYGTSDPDVSTDGTPSKLPSRYIPVGQGFFVTAETTGTINFNNNQRFFVKEDNINSIYFRQQNPNLIEDEDPRMKMRIGFNSTNTIRRQLLVTADENASLAYDWGYDGKLNESQIDDMYWMLDSEKYNIQGINEFTEDTVLPLGIHLRDAGENTITIDELINIPEHVNIYLHDKELDSYHDLKASDYTFSIDSGEYLDRFEITFNNSSLSIEDTETIENSISIIVDNDADNITIINPKATSITSVSIFNMLGQNLLIKDNIKNSDPITLPVKSFSTGGYIVKIETANGTLSKKLILK